jgi:hypothetical protein
MPEGLDSSVGIATRYGLYGSGIESRWGGGGARFFVSIQTGPGAHLASCTVCTVSFPEVKRPGRGVDHPSHLTPRFKKEYSYISTPSEGLRGLFWGDLYLYLSSIRWRGESLLSSPTGCTVAVGLASCDRRSSNFSVSCASYAFILLKCISVVVKFRFGRRVRSR